MYSLDKDEVAIAAAGLKILSCLFDRTDLSDIREFRAAGPGITRQMINEAQMKMTRDALMLSAISKLPNGSKQEAMRVLVEKMTEAI